MIHFKTPRLILLAGMMAPLSGFGANYCIAVNDGFGNGGTSFIGIGFSVPAAGSCSPWSGFTKTGTTVVLTTSGTGCLSTNGKVLTVSVSSADPPYFGDGAIGSDYIQLCPAGGTCAVSEVDQGAFSGPAAPETCTAKLLNLPAKHD